MDAANYRNLLDTAEAVLAARRDEMLTIEEWAALAKAVAACTEQYASDLLTRRDLEQVVEYRVPWDVAADGPLPGEG